MLKKCLRSYYTIPYRFFRGVAFPIRFLNITATMKCNLDCQMCLQRKHLKTFKEKGIPELSIEEIRQVIRETLPKFTVIGFCGGEIFLRNDIMDILAFATKRNPVHFATNGTLISSEMVRDFVHMNIRSILISIDGTKQMHNSIRGSPHAYDRTLQTIEFILKWKRETKRKFPEIIVNSVVMENNLSSIHDLVKTISRFGIKNLGLQMVDMSPSRFSPMQTFSEVFSNPSKINFSISDSLEDELNRLYFFSKEVGVNIQFKPEVNAKEFVDYYENKMDLSSFYCTLPWGRTIISPYGDVYPCYMLTMGSVRERSLTGIWNNVNYRDFRKSLKKHSLFPQCLGCCFMTRKPAD